MKKEKTVKCASADSLKIYIREINQYPLLTVEEEQELAALVHGADAAASEEAVQTFVNSNLRLVVKIASEFRNSGLSQSDLIAEGNIGLMRAAQLYEPGRDAKFSTYAAPWIRQYMRRAIGNQVHVIRLPEQTLKRMQKIDETEMHLKGQLNREPSIFEVSEAVNLDEKTLQKVKSSKIQIISLNAEVKEGDDSSYADIIADPASVAPDNAICTAETRELLYKSLQKLDERERGILEMRFYQGKTLEDISKQLGKTRERIRQLQNEGLLKLRLMLRKEITNIAS